MSEPTPTVFEAAPGPLSEQLEVVRRQMDEKQLRRELMLAMALESQAELELDRLRNHRRELQAALREHDQLEVAA